jgi:hypothetical protein
MLERFKEIFAGLEKAYGYTVLKGDISDKGKHEAKSFAKREPVTDFLWQKHLNGEEPSLGIFPIREDNKCKWGCIDVDVYPFDHKELINKIKEKKFPLIVFKSKSGGAHVFLFTKEFVPASLIREKLKRMAAVLGHAKREIYPKQDYVRFDKNDLPSWLNVPYHGGNNTTRYALDDNGNKLSLEDFYKAYDQKVISEKNLIHDSIIKSNAEDENDLLKGAPPCLVTLLKDGISEGGRNEMMYNVGVYLKKRYPNEWQGKMYVYNEKFMRPPLTPSEMKGLEGSLNKKDYRYKCKQSPIVDFCEAKICSNREFGVGDDGPVPEIVNIKLFPSEPPIYIVEIDGKSVEVDDQTLHDPERFSIACLNQLKQPLLPIGKLPWRKLLRKLMGANMETIPHAPESSRLDVQLRDLISDFIHRAPGKKFDDVKRGLPYSEEGVTYFKNDSFWKYLQRTKSWNIPKQKTQKMLMDIFHAREEISKLGNKKSVRVWKMKTPESDRPEVREEQMKEPPFKA